MYNYYIEYQSNAHYPTAKEIAELLGIYNEKGEKYHNPFIVAKMSEMNNEKIYFLGQKGKTQVFRNQDNILTLGFNIYTAISMIKPDHKGMVKVTMPAGGKNYKLLVDRNRILDFVDNAMEMIC